MVGHPARADRHARSHRQRGRQLRLGASARWASSPPPSTSGSRWCCSSSTRCCSGLHGLSPLRFFGGAWPAIQLAFVSRSSIGTLPVTQRVTERNLGVPRSYASFAVPLGATTKMDGCAAIYPALAAIFVAQFFGVELGVTDYLLIAFVSVVGSAATAGMTGAMVMLTLTLSTLGLPLEGVGLLLAIDPILDMSRTAINVAGQALVPTIVAKREGILDLERYRSTLHGRPAGAGRGARGSGRRPAASPRPSEKHRCPHRSQARGGTLQAGRARRGGRARRRSVGQVGAAGLVGQQRAEGHRPARAVAVTHGVAAFAVAAGRPGRGVRLVPRYSTTQPTSSGPLHRGLARAAPGPGQLRIRPAESASGCRSTATPPPPGLRGRLYPRVAGRRASASVRVGEIVAASSGRPAW